jgi:IclR helix-turn-helix domain
MSPPSESRQPRPADLAISGSRMITAFMRRIWKHNYRRINPGNMAASLPLMMALFYAAIATAEGRPLTATQLARKMKTPVSTVSRYVETLRAHGRVKITNGRKRGKGHEKLVVVDLDLLDSKMTLEHVDASIAIIKPTLEELERLREVLLEQLVANGNGPAAKVVLMIWPALDYVFG